MDFKLEGKYLEIQEQARAFARAVEPIAVEADDMSQLHPGLLAALQESGLAKLMVPAEYGGRLDRLDPLAICLVREILMGTSANADSLFAMQGIGSYAITAAGSPEQRERWLPSVARAETLAALALTEPNAGSDLKSVTTEVEPVADGLLLRAGSLRIVNNATARLEGELVGEPIDRARHQLEAEVKAVTAHGLGVKRVGEGWEATVTVDV